MVNNVYVYWNGLVDLSNRLSGKENIFVGVRPFGFHGGNKLTLLTYPLLLCMQTELFGVKPKFNFFISINDMEPHALKYLYVDGKSTPFYKTAQEIAYGKEPYPYNVFPEKTSFQFTIDPFNCCNSIVDHWQRVIEDQIFQLKKDFPGVTLNFVRNSSIKNERIFLSVLEKTICHPDILSKVLKNYGKKVFNKNFYLAGAICPECKSAQGSTSIDDQGVIFRCIDCKKESNSSLIQSNFWIHHLPLLIPRIILFNIDVCIRGGDHFQANRVEINKALMKNLANSSKDPTSLIAPMLFSYDGYKMSKSLSNERDVSLDTLKKVAVGWNKEIIPYEKVS